MARMTKAQREEQTRAIEKLSEWIKPGDTVWTILRHRARSGMQRSISLIANVEGKPMDITYWAARALDDRIDQNNGGIKVGGAGMDMGFALVYNLSATLFRDGHGCTGKGCHSNDHSNGDRNYDPHCVGYDKDGKPNGVTCEALSCGGVHWHRDGGYALRHEWI